MSAITTVADRVDELEADVADLLDEPDPRRENRVDLARGWTAASLFVGVSILAGADGGAIATIAIVTGIVGFLIARRADT